MAAVLSLPVEPWWAEILVNTCRNLLLASYTVLTICLLYLCLLSFRAQDHLPPITTGAPDTIGGGTYWEQASNGLHPDDSLCKPNQCDVHPTRLRRCDCAWTHCLLVQTLFFRRRRLMCSDVQGTSFGTHLVGSMC